MSSSNSASHVALPLELSKNQGVAEHVLDVAEHVLDVANGHKDVCHKDVRLGAREATQDKEEAEDVTNRLHRSTSASTSCQNYSSSLGTTESDADRKRRRLNDSNAMQGRANRKQRRFDDCLAASTTSLHGHRAYRRRSSEGPAMGALGHLSQNGYG